LPCPPLPTSTHNPAQLISNLKTEAVGSWKPLVTSCKAIQCHRTTIPKNFLIQLQASCNRKVSIVNSRLYRHNLFTIYLYSILPEYIMWQRLWASQAVHKKLH
jgi:hypothetical protein